MLRTGTGDGTRGKAYRSEVAVIVEGAQVIEQLQCAQQAFGGRRVHEVKVHLHNQTTPHHLGYEEY
jgi:hypothetical protein